MPLTVSRLRAGLREWRWAMSASRRRPLRALACMLAAMREQRRHESPPVPPPATASGGAALAFPPTDEPAVSIVIPVFNQPQLTRDCLRSIAAVGASRAFEVIVVDDASTDPQLDGLRATPGLTWLRNEANQGFVASCNAGAERARGATLVLLNNDTRVLPGWLDPLLDALAQPDAGLAGACLRYPDGRLQEAGGLVFADGSAWNYGRDGHPDDPRYRYRRDADYCSGAALAIPTALFRRLGGLDTRYAPAYYEDTDLAMAVRAAGLRVLYVPAAQVVHLEGASAGTDLSRGMKAHQVVNAGRFAGKWQHELADGHAVPGTDPDLAARCRARRRLAVACATDGDEAGAALSAQLVALAARRCGIDLYLLCDWPQARIQALRDAGVCVWPRDWQANARWHLRRTAVGLDAIADDGSEAGRRWATGASHPGTQARRFSLVPTLSPKAVMRQLGLDVTS